MIDSRDHSNVFEFERNTTVRTVHVYQIVEMTTTTSHNTDNTSTTHDAY